MRKMRLLKTVGFFGLVLSFICCLVLAACDNSSSSSSSSSTDGNGDDPNGSVSIQFAITNNAAEDLVRIDTHSDETDATISNEICSAGNSTTFQIIELSYPEGYYFRWRFFNNNGDFYQPEFNDSEVPFNSDPSIYAIGLNNVFGPNTASYNANTDLITILVAIDEFDNID